MAQRKHSVFSVVLGVIGELLITAGVLIGLFIVWQVWYTDIAANKLQAETVEKTVKEWGEPPALKIGKPQYTDPHIKDAKPKKGEILGIMRIPAFGYGFEYTIREGVDMESILDKGNFGKYANTAMPGQVGNFSTAAHRQTFGAPMRNVAELKDGDPIVVETKDKYLVYRVTTADLIVDPSKVEVVAPDPYKAIADHNPNSEGALNPTRRLLTITTCHPPFVSNERWIIHAELDHWVDRADGRPIEIVDPQEVPKDYKGPKPLSPSNLSTRTIDAQGAPQSKES
ncbi:sortase A [Arcanobacterium wilhelmae]|uniref:Sortase A n=1 Tax=Arcanobacterium wilhelmae TaxID=1803177 RepID=A0ABT9NB59_9ACTO|nr:class E sortase [Arcanobacterium wilhelmae]MDP9800949.1 sortase A [Arcanobacterium wilhelmae]WFN90309.1 class E sortase [Arcanobacterium wilhelmae]